MVNFTMQVRNRPRLTRQALESLASSGMDGMTVTILDDRSEEETQHFVMGWCDFHGAAYVRNEEPMGTGPLRNLVIESSRRLFTAGEFVAPHDNDTHFSLGWLENMVQCYRSVKNEGFRLLTGVGHPYHLPIGKVMAGEFSVMEVMAVPTQSTFMTWDTWDKYGPYCDTPVDRTCQSEDIFYTNKIRADGYKLGEIRPHIVHATALKNTFGEPGPGWELVKAECPPGVLCE